MARAPVTASIAVKNPRVDWLSSTLESLAAQSRPPWEIVIVDATPRPIDVPIPSSGPPVRHLHRPELGLAEQRALGIRAADTDLVLRLDEDAVLERPDHLERALEQLQEPAVVAVGGRPVPIRENTSGYVAAAVIRATGPRAYFPVHHTHLCPSGRACYPTVHRGDDVTLKAHLKRHGEVRHDDTLTIRTDLPTTKQRLDPRRLRAWFQALDEDDAGQPTSLWSPPEARGRAPPERRYF